MNLCLQNFVYEKLLLISNHIIHPFLVVNWFRYLLELFSNERKQLLKTFCILFILKSIEIFTFSERRKCTKITFFMLLSFEGSFFMIIPGREDRNFLVNMLTQSWASFRKKIQKIQNNIIIKTIKCKRTEGLSDQNRWLLALETIYTWEMKLGGRCYQFTVISDFSDSPDFLDFLEFLDFLDLRIHYFFKLMIWFAQGLLSIKGDLLLSNILLRWA